MTVRRKRVLALAMASIVIASLIAMLVGPVAIRFSKQAREHSEEFARLARATIHAKEHDSVRAAVMALASRPIWSKIYRNLTPDQATAALQADVRNGLGPRNNGAVLRPLDSHGAGSLVEIGTHVHLTTASDGLADALSGLSISAKWLRIRSLKVVSPAVQRDDRNEALEIEMDIVGYLIPEPWDPPT